jgi:hypothetical protein
MATAQIEMYKPESLGRHFTPPITPPNAIDSKALHPWPGSDNVPEEIWDFPSKRRKLASGKTKVLSEAFDVPHQEVLLLHGVKQRYAHTKEQPIPSLKNDREMLVAVEVIGLNPIDWKAPYVVTDLEIIQTIANIVQRFWLGFTRTALYQRSRSRWKSR